MKIFELIIVTCFMCAIGFALLIRDITVHGLNGKSNNPDHKITNFQITYCIIMVCVTVGASVLFATVYGDNSIWFNLKRLALLCVMWPIGLIDYKTYRIPNSFIILGLMYRVILFPFELIFESEIVWHTLLGEIIAATALLLAAVLCTLCMKGAIGFGDMKLFIVMGIMLGTDGIWGAIFLSLIISFFISIYLLIAKKKSRKDVIPFGPALVAGTFLSVCLTGM